MNLKWPLMNNNIIREDLDAVVSFLQGDPALTQSANVRAFEKEWSEWLGVRNSVFLNSGSSANFLAMSIIRRLFGKGEVIVPTLTWVSDISSVLYNDLTPVFVDINPLTLGMNEEQVIAKITKKTKAVFLSHILGFNALTDRLLDALKERNIPLVEDACESHGATFNGQKVGTFGFLSNFSFYFAHHMSSIEGGILCSNDEDAHQLGKILRSNGMVRESDSEEFRMKYEKAYPDLNPKFIFAYPSCNFRVTEINAVIARNQLKRLDDNNELRRRHFKLFLDNLDPSKYKTDFRTEGSVNYALILILREPNESLRNAVTAELDKHGIEHRRGTSGGGNQLRQPYLRGIVKDKVWEDFPEVDHVHFFGFYVGNYPSLEDEKILALCDILNRVG